jgi:hypothetical protein
MAAGCSAAKMQAIGEGAKEAEFGDIHREVLGDK